MKISIKKGKSTLKRKTNKKVKFKKANQHQKRKICIKKGKLTPKGKLTKQIKIKKINNKKRKIGI